MNQQGSGSKGKKGLLDNQRTRLALAILLSIFCWVMVTMVVQPNTTQYFSSVPVNFTYDSSKYTSQGLSIVNDPEYSVSLKVYGNGSVIGGLTRDDFVVYPDYSSVKASGEASLRLKVRCTAEQSDGVTVSLVKNDTKVDVVFDTVEEKSIPITVSAKDLQLADGYVLAKATAAPGEVTLTGPTGELENITKAVANVTVSGELNKTVTVTTELQFTDDAGDPITFTYVTSDNTQADVTLTVYKLAELPVSINFINAPDNFDSSVLHYSLSQKTLKVAGPENVVSGLTELAVGSIDLSTFALDKVYELPIKLPSGLVNQENISTLTVSFDCSNLSTKTLNVPAANVQVLNLPSTYQLQVKSERIMNVVLCGPSSVLEGLTADSVIAQIDADELSISTGQQNIAVHISVPASAQVFAIGTYSVQCQIASN